MNDATAKLRAVIVERDIRYPPERVWHALTQPHLLQEWLMQTDFAAEVDRSFTFRGDWGSVDCRVLDADPYETLSYTWNALGLESAVRWVLTATPSGTHLRMEQTGFRKDQEQAYQGAKAGWPRMIDKLQAVMAQDVSAA